MLHLKLTIAYDGTGLVGWQRQLTGTSVQALLEEALAPLDGRPVRVTGAGRTDAGVHALAQVASVTLQCGLDPAAVVRAANMRLPPAVRVLSAEPVAEGFHARFDALAKLYRYQIWNGDVVSPFERRYVWHIARPALDAAAMDAAARRLEGRHDFAAFAAAGREPETTVRTIFSSRVHRAHDRYGLRLQRDAAAVGAATDAPHDRASAPFDAPLIVYEVSGDGFLRHMVRAIVGTLVEIGRGRRAPAWVDDVLSSRERHAAGRTAPPAGLFLAQVRYR